jgi:hypothetical protein
MTDRVRYLLTLYSLPMEQAVKQAVLDSKYSAIVAEMLKEHLQKQNVTAAKDKNEDRTQLDTTRHNKTRQENEMVHVTRKSIWEEQELLANVKIGDWVEVSYDYLPGTCLTVESASSLLSLT